MGVCLQPALHSPKQKTNKQGEMADESAAVWTKLVRRTCPVGPESQPMDEKALVRANKKKLAPLLELLKMAEDPSKMKLTLLEVICERFPHTAERVRWGVFPQFVKVGFSPSDKEHRVS